MLYCIWMSCFIYIASLAPQMNFCWDKEIEYRMQYIEYKQQWKGRCYKMGTAWENWCYDCTGIIYSFFHPWKGKRNIDATYPYYTYFDEVSAKDAKSWDLVLFLPREEWQWTHTATFIKQEWNNIIILDAFTLKTKTSERTIPLQWNIHKIVIVKNKYLDWF